LGDGTNTNKTLPVQIKQGTKFKTVSAGSGHTMAIDESGNLWGWGNNFSGQLGDGTNTNKTSPVQIKSGTKFQEVSTGSRHSLAIDEMGNLWAWGGNDFGQLGDGSAWSEIPIWLNTGYINLVTGLTLSAETATIRRDSTFQLTGTVIPSNASNDTVFWSSSDETIAKVDFSGLVTGVKSGTATITATTIDGGKTATCEVTVLAGLSVQISENGTHLMVYPNPLKGGQLNIRLNEQTSDADLIIFNANGQLVYSGLIRTKETVQIEYKTFKPGLYLIKVSNNEMNGVRKILVE
jgi:hypothetical protein